MEDQSELTQLSEHGLDKFDKEEKEIESLNYVQASYKDNTNDIFNQIQNEDLEQEKYTDRKVQQVIKQQQKALNQVPLMSEAEFEAKQLENSLIDHQLHEKELQKQDELLKVRAVSNSQLGQDVNAAADDKTGTELLEGQSDMHLENMEFSQSMIGQ